MNLRKDFSLLDTHGQCWKPYRERPFVFCCFYANRTSVGYTVSSLAFWPWRQNIGVGSNASYRCWEEWQIGRRQMNFRQLGQIIPVTIQAEQLVVADGFNRITFTIWTLHLLVSRPRNDANLVEVARVKLATAASYWIRPGANEELGVMERYRRITSYRVL